MAKPVPRFVLNTRAANKILTILEKESAGDKRIILRFVEDNIDKVSDAQPVPDPRQPSLFNGLGELVAGAQ